MFCIKCGNMLVEGALFCSKCGERVYSVESAPPESLNCEEAVAVEEANDGESVSIDAVRQHEVIATAEGAGSREEAGSLKEINSEVSVPTEEVNDTAAKGEVLSEEDAARESEKSSDAGTAEKNISVTLKSVGNEKVKIIKLVREWTGMDLKESKKLVEKVPVLLKQNISLEEAEKIKTAFECNGAEVSLINQDAYNEKAETHGGSCEETMEEDGTRESEGSSDGGTAVEEEQECPEEKKENFGKKPETTKVAKAIDSFIGWHESCWKKNKILTSVLIIAEILLVLWLLIETWEVLLGIVIIASIVLPFIMKKDFPDEARQNAKEVIQGLAKVIAGVIIFLIVVFNWDSISSIWRPGAVVRDSYFLNYSDEITIGEALENVYTDCEWSTYSYNGNEYVRFQGNFIDDTGEIGHHQIDFSVIGDSATIDSWRIDGIDVSWAEVLMLVSIYERNGVSW